MSYASDLGLMLSSKIKVLVCDGGCFNSGDIIQLVNDDMSKNPWFVKQGGYEKYPFNLLNHKWEHYKEEEKGMTFELEVGDKVEIISTGIFREGMVKIGDIATYDGSYFSCPTWEDTQCCTKYLWSKYLKPYVAAKPKTPFEQAGYTEETKFKVLEAQYGFRKGEIVTLDWDDNSSCPRFKSERGHTAFLYFSTIGVGKTDLEVYVEESEADNTNTLEFPCCVAVSEIKDEETFKKILDLFIANGADKYEVDWGDGDYYKYFGVDSEDGTVFYNCVESYSFDDVESEVTVYTAGELLAMTPKEETTTTKEVTLLPVGTSEVTYKLGDKVVIEDNTMFNRDFVKVGDVATVVGFWKDNGLNLICPTWEYGQVARISNVRPFVNVNKEVPSVHVEPMYPKVGDKIKIIGNENGHTFETGEIVTVVEDYSDGEIPNWRCSNRKDLSYVWNGWVYVGEFELVKDEETTTEEAPLVTIVKDVTYSVGIKGTLFTFTQDEINELVSELQGFEDYE